MKTYLPGVIFSLAILIVSCNGQRSHSSDHAAPKNGDQPQSPLSVTPEKTYRHVSGATVKNRVLAEALFFRPEFHQIAFSRKSLQRVRAAFVVDSARTSVDRLYALWSQDVVDFTASNDLKSDEQDPFTLYGGSDFGSEAYLAEGDPRVVVFPFYVNLHDSATYHFGDTAVVAFHIGYEASFSVFTIWKVSGDSLHFLTVLDTVVSEGIGYAEIDRVMRLSPTRFLVTGTTGGGDGGDAWGSTWLGLWTWPRHLKVLCRKGWKVEMDEDPAAEEFKIVVDSLRKTVEFQTLELANDRAGRPQKWKVLERKVFDLREIGGN